MLQLVRNIKSVSSRCFPVRHFNNSVIKIPVDEKYKDLLDSLKMQKLATFGAWIFYPGVQILSGIPSSYFAVYCSSVHSLASKDIINQIGSKYYSDIYNGKRYWINNNDELLIQSPNWRNFWWNTYKLPNKNSNNIETTLDYINMSVLQKQFVNDIYLSRQYRFRISMGSLIILSTSIFAQHNCYNHVYLYSTFLGMGVYYFITMISHFYELKNKKQNPTIKHNKPYYYIDINRNIHFTDKKYGLRKRYKTINDA